MSRVGNRILSIPAGVTVSVDGNIVTVKGPKGELSTEIHNKLNVEITDTEVRITRENDNFKSYHGTANANIRNMIVGVTEGYEKKLLITGTGYKAELKNGSVVLNLGYSHQITMVPPTGITYTVPKIDEIHVIGIDKELVGQCAAEIRAHRRPEPYHGKGVRYSTEVVRRKEIKKAAK